MSNYQNIQHNFLNKYPRLQPRDSEWTRIEYLLQLSLGSTTAAVKNIWNVANALATTSFEKSIKDGQLVLESWLDTQQLDDNNRLEKVCTKGFEFPPSGLQFPTGHIKLQYENISRGRTYEFIMLKIAVGKSFCLPYKNLQKDKYKLPNGFDSIYLYNDDDNDPMNSVFKHDYQIYDNSRVLASYIVNFEFDARKEDGLIPQMCDICNEELSTIYCKADDLGLCQDCDQEHHLKGGKLVHKHIRVPISEKPKQFGFCQQHSDQKLELYCTVDHIPLCVMCKIEGSHKSGESSNHPLVKIQDAYTKALIESRETDPLIEKRKNQLADLLQTIDLRIKDVNKNASSVEERIYQILQEALLQLQEETQRKMSFLIGDQLELKRQYDQLQWMESFLKYQQEILPPQEYLNSWSRHMVLRNEVLSLSNVPTQTNVQPDIRLMGKINVLTEYTYKNLNEQGNHSDNQDQHLDLSQMDAASVSASSKFRSTIFNKHQVGDKNQKLIKSIVSSSMVRSQQNFNNNDSSLNQGPELSFVRGYNKQQQIQVSKFQNQTPTIQENEQNESQFSDQSQDL